MLQNDIIAKYFRLELTEIWTWKQINNGRLTPMRPAAYRTFVVKSNYLVFFLEIYMKCILGTLFCAWRLMIF
jgi:hypothetical protein